MSTHRLLGKTVIPLHQVSRSGQLDSNFPLTGKDGSPTTVSACVCVCVCVRVCVHVVYMYISGSVSVCCMFFAVCCLILPLYVSKVNSACYWWTEPLLAITFCSKPCPFTPGQDQPDSCVPGPSWGSRSRKRGWGWRRGGMGR